MSIAAMQNLELDQLKTKHERTTWHLLDQQTEPLPVPFRNRTKNIRHKMPSALLIIKGTLCQELHAIFPDMTRKQATQMTHHLTQASKALCLP